MRQSFVIRPLAFVSALVLVGYAAGCSDDGSTTSSSASGSSSSSSSSGDVSSSSSSSSSSSTGGAGGMAGAGGAGGMAGAGGTGGMAGMGGAGGSGGGVPLICEPGTMAACYTGPAGTKDVGLCVGGMWTCNAEGTAYGPCVGEVVPVAENCTTPLDENCNGAGPDCGAGVWSKRFGDFDGQYGRSVASDALGNVYVVGVFYSKLDFGAGPLTATNLDAYLVKFDPAGNLLWSKQFTGPFGEYATSVAVDSAGNVVVAGNFQGPTDFGGGPLTAVDLDAFVAKYDPSGKHIWSKSFGAADVQSVSTLAIDKMDNIVLGGIFQGTVDFGGGPFSSPANIDMFGVKLDSNGNHLWSKQFDQTDGNQPELTDLAVDDAGNVAFTGYFYGTMDFGGGPLTSVGSYDIFVLKFGANGQHLWSKRYGNASGESPSAVAYDSAGNLFLAGAFKTSLNFGGTTLTSAGSDDGWLVKLDSGGAHVWSKRFGDSQQQFISGLAVSKTEDLGLAITSAGSVDYGGGPVTSAGGVDIVTVRLDNAGNHIWSRRAGDINNQGSYAIAFDPAGYVLLTGELVASADFGNGLLTSAGSADLFVAKLAP